MKLRIESRQGDVQFVLLASMFTIVVFVILVLTVFARAYDTWLTLEEAAQAGARYASVEVSPEKRCELIKSAVDEVIRRSGRIDRYKLVILYNQSDPFREASVDIILSTLIALPALEDPLVRITASYRVYPDTLTSMVSWGSCN